jgi:hypothetical protein
MNSRLRFVHTAVAAIILSTPIAASADRHWHDRDIHRFYVHDEHHWATGHWYHGFHGGRLSWWWVVGPAIDTALWYSYPGPIYPYPDPYAPPTVVVVPAPAQTQMAPPVNELPPPTVWYYCKSSNQYYPYVANCPEGWKTVPATPPQ